MQLETKNFAEYHNSVFSVRETIEVKDEQDAVEKAAKDTSRFVMFERSFMDYEGETLSGKPKNHGAFVYTNVDNVLSRDDVIASFQKDLDAAKGDTLSDTFSNKITIDVLQGLINRFGELDASASFIAEGGRSGSFITLKEGEKVYGRDQKQIWPQADNAPDLSATLVP